MPKYCKQCEVQGHGDDMCKTLHPELRKSIRRNEREPQQEQQGDNNEDMRSEVAPKRRRVVRRYWKPTDRLITRDNIPHNGVREQRVEPGHAINTTNAFDALSKKIWGGGSRGCRCRKVSQKGESSEAS